MAKRSAAMPASDLTHGCRGYLSVRSAWAGHPVVSRKTHKTRQSCTAYNQTMLRKMIIIFLTLAAVETTAEYMYSLASEAWGFDDWDSFFFRSSSPSENWGFGYGADWGIAGAGWWRELLPGAPPLPTHNAFSLGFGYHSGGSTLISGGVTHFEKHAVICPTIFAIVAFAAYPMLAFIRGPLRRRRWRKKGCCCKCGYDLTGNVTGICPECGTEAKEPKSSGLARCLVLLAVWLFLICLAGALLAPRLARISYPRPIDWAVLAFVPVGAFYAAKHSRHRVVFTLYGALSSCVFWFLSFGNRTAVWCDALVLAYMIVKGCLVTVALVAACRLAMFLRPRWDARRRYPEGHCQACGYDLTGNVSGICPECGSRIPDRRAE